MGHRKTTSDTTGCKLSHGSGAVGSQCPECGTALRQRRKARFTDGGSRIGKIGNLTRDSQDVPMLRLSGKWLAQAGFDVGQQIEIDVQQGTLTIRHATEALEEHGPDA